MRNSTKKDPAKMFGISSLLLAFIVARAIGFACEKKFKYYMDDSGRDQVIVSINDYRSNVAKSLGKNIYKIEYDCELEENAAYSSHNCHFTEGPFYNLNGKASQTTAAVKPKVARRYQTSGKEPAIIMKEATALWWAEATPSKSNIFSVADKATKSNFTQMIWGKSTKVGCSIKQTCNEDNRLHSPFYVDYVVCLFKEGGNKVGEPIYDIGNGCNSDNDCTAFSNSRCDRSTSLCELQKSEMEKLFDPYSVPQCSNRKISEGDRRRFRKIHNDYREVLANAGGPGNSATDFYQLNYDCDLENSAQQVANQCEGGTIPKDRGQNSELTSAQSNADAIKAALSKWWNEGHNVPTSLAQRNVYSHEWGAYSRYTQMAWGKTTKVGCGINDCGQQKLVVCHYKERGNKIGEDVYETGLGCSSDSECTQIPNSKCNTDRKLCVAV